MKTEEEDNRTRCHPRWFWSKQTKQPPPPKQNEQLRCVCGWSYERFLGYTTQTCLSDESLALLDSACFAQTLPVYYAVLLFLL